MEFLNSFLDAVQPYVGIVFITLLGVLIVLSAIYWVINSKPQVVDRHTGKVRGRSNLGGPIVEEKKHEPLPQKETPTEAPLNWEEAIQPPILQASKNNPPPKKIITAPTPENLSSSEQESTPQQIDSLSAIADKLQKARQIKVATNQAEVDDNGFKTVVEAGKSAMSSSNWEQARKYFEEAIKLSPQNPDILVRLAIACYELGDLDTSEEYLAQAIAINPLAQKAFHKHLSFRV